MSPIIAEYYKYVMNHDDYDKLIIFNVRIVDDFLRAELFVS